jgi:hypothetical protein
LTSATSLSLPAVPKSVEIAITGPEAEHWIKAIEAELIQLQDRGTFEFAGYTGPGAKSKIILAVKFDNNMNLKYKARLVLCGYSQVKGMNYNQTYAPTISKSPVFILLQIAVLNDWKISLIDVGNAFLEAQNDFPIYMYLPREILAKDEPPIRMKVINSLYGEKQAAYLWNERINKILTEYMSLTRLISDPCVYVMYDREPSADKDNSPSQYSQDQATIQPRRVIAAVTIHVDDMLVMGESSDLVTYIIKELQTHVKKLTVFNDFQKYLGMNLIQDPLSRAISISQRSYIQDIVREFDGMFNRDSNTINGRSGGNKTGTLRFAVNRVPLNPSKFVMLLNYPLNHNCMSSGEAMIKCGDRDVDIDSDGEDEDDYSLRRRTRMRNEINQIGSFIGKIRYLVDNSRPDLLTSVGILSEGGMVINPDSKRDKLRFDLCRDFYKYLKKESENESNENLTCLRLGNKDPNLELFGYSDASYITYGDCKSRLGGAFFITKDSGAICSYSKKDISVSHSSTEAEIKAIDLCIRTIIYLRDLLRELGYPQHDPTKLYVDNKSAMQICESLKGHNRIKHLNVRINYIRQMVNARVVELLFVPSAENVADILTKPLARPAFERCSYRLLKGFDNINKFLDPHLSSL